MTKAKQDWDSNYQTEVTFRSPSYEMFSQIRLNTDTFLTDIRERQLLLLLSVWNCLSRTGHQQQKGKIPTAGTRQLPAVLCTCQSQTQWSHSCTASVHPASQIKEKIIPACLLTPGWRATIRASKDTCLWHPGRTTAYFGGPGHPITGSSVSP